MSAVISNIHDERDKALGNALKEIEKAYGMGSVMTLDDGAVADVEVISTGSIGIDRALGVGGIPRGRIIEVYGPESSGKTTLTLQMIAQAQKGGGRAAFIDAEHALDPSYAQALGVNTAELLVSQPDHGEQALDIAEKLIRSGAVDLIVVDSVAALTPKAELEASMDASQMGLHARMMSKACRMLTGAISHTKCTVVFVNQIRHKIGVMFGSPEVTTGGNALKFYASVRIDIRSIAQLKTGDEVVGKRTRVKIVKCKVAPPFKSYECDIIFGRGIYRPAELIDLGIEVGFVQKSGTWFSLGDVRLGQGKSNACEYLVDNPDVADELEADIRSVLFDDGVIPDDSDVSNEGTDSENVDEDESDAGD
jgi:recombination protein RecA